MAISHSMSSHVRFCRKLPSFPLSAAPGTGSLLATRHEPWSMRNRLIGRIRIIAAWLDAAETSIRNQGLWNCQEALDFLDFLTQKRAATQTPKEPRIPKPTTRVLSLIELRCTSLTKAQTFTLIHRSKQAAFAWHRKKNASFVQCSVWCSLISAYWYANW